jgi:hypothetical protein
MELEFSQQILKKYSNVKFHENLFQWELSSSISETEMTKLIVAFYSFVYMPK